MSLQTKRSIGGVYSGCTRNRVADWIGYFGVRGEGLSMPGRPGLAMAVFSGALPRSGATSGHPATAPEPLYLLDKRNKPRSLLAAGFFVNRLVRQFRTANSSSAGRIRTYNPPVNSRLLYH